MNARYVVQVDIETVDGRFKATAAIVDGYQGSARAATPGVAAARAVRRAIDATRSAARRPRVQP